MASTTTLKTIHLPKSSPTSAHDYVLLRQIFLLLPFITSDALLAMKLVSKMWKRAVGEVIDEDVESGDMIVHDGKDVKED